MTKVIWKYCPSLGEGQIVSDITDGWFFAEFVGLDHPLNLHLTDVELVKEEELDDEGFVVDQSVKNPNILTHTEEPPTIDISGPYMTPALKRGKKILTENQKDTVNSPSHYSSGEIECIVYLKDNLPEKAYIGYLEGSFKKYLHRWRYKTKPLEDLRKARWFLERLIKELEDGAEP